MRYRLIFMPYGDTHAHGFTNANEVFSFTSKDPTGIKSPGKIAELISLEIANISPVNCEIK